MNKKLLYLTYLGMFLLVTGVSYWAFDTYLPTSKTKTSQGDLTSPKVTQAPKKDGILTFEGPKTEVCPMNGVLYSKEQKNLWSTKRPLLVMIENHLDSRPQSGLSSADVVYEVVAEGGITRFMGVYYCAAQAGSSQKYDVGPVRSARTYFLDLASEYADYPLYAHVGGANCSGGESASKNRSNCTSDRRTWALEQIDDYGWTKNGTHGDLNQFSLSYKVCRREYERTGQERATEHTMYCSTQALWDTAAERGLTNMTVINKKSWDKNFRSWSFNQKDVASSVINAPNISFEFWKGYKDYSVSWTFDQTNNRYLRNDAGQKSIDFNTQEQITAKNIIIQFAKESRSVDEHLHNLYGVIGTGTGVLLQNGTKTEITWSKPTRTSRTIFKDTSGKEINFVPGTIWVEILPIGNTVSYEG